MWTSEENNALDKLANGLRDAKDVHDKIEDPEQKARFQQAVYAILNPEETENA